MTRAKGQSMLEFAMFVAFIVAAMIVMAPYLRNALSGKMRETAETFGRGAQYEPNVTTIEVK